ncbi:hypothetical protein CA833_00250 [Novosphingobium sp. KA1]|nr:hypothetical protein CA833_00250 [Novosphingobium sp. KA1]
MGRAPSAFRQTDVVRAVKAARSADMTVSGVEIAPDGTIRILTTALPEAPASPFDKWRSKRDARAN